MHDQAYHSNSDSSDSEAEAYAPRKSKTKTLRPIFGLIENEGPSITLTTPSCHGNPSLAVQDALLAKRIAEPGKLNPGTWLQAMAQHRRNVHEVRKEKRSRSEDPYAYRAGSGWRGVKSKSGTLSFINYETGESTKEEPRGYLDPDTRFRLGMGIKEKPGPKSASTARRRSGLWETVMMDEEPAQDDLSTMFQKLSIQSEEVESGGVDDVAGRYGGFQEGTAYQMPRGRSRTSRPRYYALLQAENFRHTEGFDEVRGMAETVLEQRVPEQAEQGDSLDMEKWCGSSIGGADDQVEHE